MTTDNRTNEPTAEQILVDEWIRQADRAKSMTGMDAIWFPDAEETLAVLRANGLLSEGAPSEEQIERAARAIRADYVQRYPEEPPVYHAGAGQPVWRHMARAALVAAGDAPQAPSRLPDFFAPKPMSNSYVPAQVLPSSGVDEDARANLIHSTSVAHFGGLDPRVAPIIARALCEAYMEGKLT